MNKKILVFLLVAIVALSLSAVSAADNTTDDVSVLSSYDDNAVVSEATNDISIDVTAKDITYGENATVEAKIIPNTTTGNIKFSLDNKSINLELLLMVVQV